MFGKKKNEGGGNLEEAVMAALATVMDPDLNRDLVSLNMIRNLEIADNDISFTIMLTTPACPLKGKMEGDARVALAKVEGIGEVTVKFDADVPYDQRIREQSAQQFREADRVLQVATVVADIDSREDDFPVARAEQPQRRGHDLFVDHCLPGCVKSVPRLGPRRRVPRHRHQHD